jgi:hypothetical protein
VLRQVRTCITCASTVGVPAAAADSSVCSRHTLTSATPPCCCLLPHTGTAMSHTAAVRWRPGAAQPQFHPGAHCGRQHIACTQLHREAGACILVDPPELLLRLFPRRSVLSLAHCAAAAQLAWQEALVAAGVPRCACHSPCAHPRRCQQSFPGQVPATLIQALGDAPLHGCGGGACAQPARGIYSAVVPVCTHIPLCWPSTRHRRCQLPTLAAQRPVLTHTPANSWGPWSLWCCSQQCPILRLHVRV